MTPKRLYILLIALVALLFGGLVAGTYGTNLILTQQANKLTSLKAKSMALTQEQAGLNAAKSEVKKYSNLEQVTQAVVPEDKDQAQTVLEIANFAQKENIKLGAITFPASTLGNTSVSAPSSSSTSTSTASSAASSASSPTSPLNSLSQLVAVKNIPGVYQLPITVQSDATSPVPFSSIENFLSDLEHNRRTALITTISIAPSSNDPKLLTFTINLEEFIKP